MLYSIRKLAVTTVCRMCINKEPHLQLCIYCKAERPKWKIILPVVHVFNHLQLTVFKLDVLVYSGDIVPSVIFWIIQREQQRNILRMHTTAVLQSSFHLYGNMTLEHWSLFVKSTHASETANNSHCCTSAQKSTCSSLSNSSYWYELSYSAPHSFMTLQCFPWLRRLSMVDS